MLCGSHASEDDESLDCEDVAEIEVRAQPVHMRQTKLSNPCGQPRIRRSADYETIVAACVEVTFSSPFSKIVVPQFHHRDVIQIISTWSAKNDGVLRVQDGAISADGMVNQPDGMKSVETAYLHCHKLTDDVHALALIPCWRAGDGKFACPVAGSRSLSLLAGNMGGPGSAAGSLFIKQVDPNGSSIRTDGQCGWFFEPQAIFDPGANVSRSRIWRIYCKLESTDAQDGDKSASGKFYLMADRSGAVSLTMDAAPGSLRCFDTGGTENPKTYFYLYKKTHIADC